MKINQLTFFRFLAAVIVVIFHYGRKSYFARLSPALISGPVMVLFFFVLSGFIMVVAYGGENDLNRSKYWFARLARIAPVYYLALALTLWGRFISDAEIRLTPFLLHVSFLQAWSPKYALSLNGPAWSLSVEMFFYFLFPFLLIWLKKLSSRGLLVSALIFWLASMVVLTFLNSFVRPHFDFIHEIVFYFPPSHLSSFVLGMAGGLLYRRHLTTKRLSPLFSAALTIFSFALIVFLLHEHSRLKWLSEWSYAYGLLSPLFLLFILCLAMDRSVLAQIFSNNALVFLGELGYSIYILQNPLHKLYEIYIMHNQAQYLSVLSTLSRESHFYLYLLALIVLSVFTYLFVEKPMRHWLRQIADKLIARSNSFVPDQVT